jgi:hypothetical protein
MEIKFDEVNNNVLRRIIWETQIYIKSIQVQMVKDERINSKQIKTN